MKEEGGRKKEEGRSGIAAREGGVAFAYPNEKYEHEQSMCMDGMCRGTCVLFTMEVWRCVWGCGREKYFIGEERWQDLACSILSLPLSSPFPPCCSIC